MSIRKKQACVDCHFFVKQAAPLPSPQVYVSLVTREERQQAKAGDYAWSNHYSLGCHMLVWDEGHQFDATRKHAAVVVADRRKFCFFWEFRPGMMLPAARTLQEREAADSRAARNRTLTTIGLWIAALALVADVIVGLMQRCSLGR